MLSFKSELIRLGLKPPFKREIPNHINYNLANIALYLIII